MSVVELRYLADSIRSNLEEMEGHIEETDSTLNELYDLLNDIQGLGEDIAWEDDVEEMKILGERVSSMAEEGLNIIG